MTYDDEFSILKDQTQFLSLLGFKAFFFADKIYLSDDSKTRSVVNSPKITKLGNTILFNISDQFKNISIALSNKKQIFKSATYERQLEIINEEDTQIKSSYKTDSGINTVTSLTIADTKFEFSSTSNDQIRSLLYNKEAETILHYHEFKDDQKFILNIIRKLESDTFELEVETNNRFFKISKKDDELTSHIQQFFENDYINNVLLLLIYDYPRLLAYLNQFLIFDEVTSEKKLTNKRRKKNLSEDAEYQIDNIISKNRIISKQKIR
ncbi:MAG: hypothetical protein RR404_00680 [Bacilli bacterium]